MLDNVKKINLVKEYTLHIDCCLGTIKRCSSSLCGNKRYTRKENANAKINVLLSSSFASRIRLWAWYFYVINIY